MKELRNDADLRSGIAAQTATARPDHVAAQGKVVRLGGGLLLRFRVLRPFVVGPILFSFGLTLFTWDGFPRPLRRPG